MSYLKMELEKSVVYSFCYFLWCLHCCFESPPQESSIKRLHNFHQLTLIKQDVLEGHSVNLGYKLPAVSFQLSEILEYQLLGQAISFRRVVLYQLIWNGCTSFYQSKNRDKNFLLLVGTTRMWKKKMLCSLLPTVLIKCEIRGSL